MLVFSIFYIFRTTGCRNSKNSNFPMKNIFFKIVKKEKVCEDNFKEIKILKSGFKARIRKRAKFQSRISY